MNLQLLLPLSGKALPLLTAVFAAVLVAWPQAILRAQTGDKAVRVQTVPLQELLVYPSKSVAASVESLNHAQISSEAEGRIQAVFALVGDTVKQGQKLAQLDCRAANLERTAALSSLALAKQEAGRAKMLNRTNSIAEQQFNQAQSSYEQAGIRLQQAKLAVTRCLLLAPYDGVVTARMAALGAYATVGLPLFSLLDTENIELTAALGEAARGSIIKAKHLSFITAGENYPVIIRTWLPLVDSKTNQRTIRLRFTDDLPLVGAAGELIWEEETARLPSNLLVQRANQLGYFMAVAGKAQFVAVADAALGESVAIPTPVQDISIITQGRYNLSDGDKLDLPD